IQKVLDISKLYSDITYQHHRELDNLFSTFLNTALTYNNTATQIIHDNTTTQATHDNTTTQITHNNTNLLNAEISDIDIANSNNNISLLNKIQNEYLDKNNKEIEDNEECDLTYISKTEFGEYLQE
ncbi:9871_t:CDS:1, partial [Scutellospora calospora]